MTTRSYTNTLLLEGALDAISPSASFASLAEKVMQPSVKIVEEDCGTLLGERTLLSYASVGRIPSGEAVALNAASIEASINAGQAYKRLRSTSTCISDGGVCKLCFRSTSPELGTGTGTFDPVLAPTLYSRSGAIPAGSTSDDLYRVGGKDTPPLATIKVYLGIVLLATTTSDSTGAWLTNDLAFFTAGTHSLTYAVVYNGVEGSQSPASLVTIRGIDQYDQLVTLYLTGEGTPGAGVTATATDSEIVQNFSPYSRAGNIVVTPEVKYSTLGISKFGSTSFEFFDGQDSRIRFPVRGYLDDLGNADWTIEFQIRPKSSGSTMLIAQQATGTGNYGWQFLLNADGTIKVLVIGLIGFGGAWSVNSVATCPVGQWTYVRATRSNDFLTLEVGSAALTSVQIGTWSNGLRPSLSFNYADSVILGGYATTLVASLDAYLGYFRITRGVARTDTPPVAAFVSSRPARVQLEKIVETFSGSAGTPLVGSFLDSPGTDVWANYYGSSEVALFQDGLGSLISTSGHSSSAYSVSSSLSLPVPPGPIWVMTVKLHMPSDPLISAGLVSSLEIRLGTSGDVFWLLGFNGSGSPLQRLNAGTTPAWVQDYPPGGATATLRLTSCGQSGPTGKILATLCWGDATQDSTFGEVQQVCPALQASYTQTSFDEIVISMRDYGMSIQDLRVTTQAWANPIVPPLLPSTPGIAEVTVNPGDVLPAESSYVLDTQILNLTAPTSAVELTNPEGSFYKLRVYVDGKLKPSAAYTVSGTSLSLTVPATSQVAIKYVAGTNSPFFYELAKQYFGSLIGIRPLTAVRLPLKKTLYEQLTPKEDIDELIEALSRTDAPVEAVEYLRTCKSQFEKSIGALLLASLFMQ